jgi:hypothetical protein
MTERPRQMARPFALLRGPGWSRPDRLGVRSWSPIQTGSTRPRSTLHLALPRRLTFNLGDDRTPSWLPDGSGIIYSSEREDRPDHDHTDARIRG